MFAVLAFSVPMVHAQSAPAVDARGPSREGNEVDARGPAREGDDAAARAAFELGRSAYDRGRFAEALAHFERAYALSPHPKLLFNVARAAEAEGQTVRAIEAYRAYLGAIPNADNREFVEARLARLESGVAAAPSAPAPAGAEPAMASAPVAAPSPEAAARTEATPLVASSASNTDRDVREPARPFWKRGWFWGVVGVVVAGAVTTGIVLAIDRDPQPVKADEHILTLGAR